MARCGWSGAARGGAGIACAAALVGPLSAAAFEAFDGRLQVHGSVESVARSISSNFSDDWDLTQWQAILNLELEWDVAPEGVGPFTAVSAFARLEARYDCVWTRACGLARSADAYGDRARQGAFYFTNMEESPFSGTAFGKVDAGRIQNDGRYVTMNELRPLDQLFELKGPDQVRGTADDPGALVFADFVDYVFTGRRVRGPLDGMGTEVYGPWLPKQDVRPLGALRTIPNALSPLDENLSTGSTFTGQVNPFRPYPFVPAETAAAGGVPLTDASGLYYPSAGLQRTLREERFSPFDQNFHQWELEWNRGGSQQDEKELKELYVDLELLDGRLYLRLGKQIIVWGKTEIFRSQDQFNPQDVGLATLAGLEESRIGLWAAKAIWSFYDVGPLEDVRLELAALLDDFEPIDVGDCGEPYAPSPSCLKSLGLFFHGITGLGLAGEIRPDAWWNSSRGLEAGARLEWRWRRFSFALTDYYGFDDIPYPDPIFSYQRNVDPRTGRPRLAGSEEGCDPEGLFGGGTGGCLGSPSGAHFVPVPDTATTDLGRIPGERARFERGKDEILRRHHANQGLMQTFCAATVGFTDLIPGLENECIFNVFGSQTVLTLNVSGFPVSVLIAEATGQVLAGSNTLLSIIQLGGLELAANLPFLPPLIPLNTRDPRTGEGRTASGIRLGPFAVLPIGNLSSALTPEQQALLGCGAYYGTSCDTAGVDLLNAEASALLQSFPGFEGTPIMGFTTLRGPQPGTLGFQGGPVCTRFERGRTFILPGCRGPEDPGYDASIDGIPVFRERPLEPLTTALPLGDVAAFDDLGFIMRQLAGVPQCPRVTTPNGLALTSPNIRFFHPLTCTPFRSEMAALSYNLLSAVVLLSSDQDDDGFDKPSDADEFDPSRPFDPNRCSFAAPQFCLGVRALVNASGVGRNDLRAGGSSRFGRRDFLWHSGQELVLRYDRRNVLGFSLDFAEDWAKTNWSIEATWFEEVPALDRNARDGTTEVDIYNLTLSVDRPTFVNFLNANRTFFLNGQLFLSYVPQHEPSFSATGPWNALGTFTVLTAYFQDRLFTVLTAVYDVQSNSGAGLPSIAWRFTETFSAQFGMAFFFGRFQQRVPYLVPPLAVNRTGRHAYKDFVEPGLAIVRDRDEVYLRLRWTF